MKKIDSAGAYATPPMNLKKDENYAGTSEDREPFSGTQPFKENFLLQMEYAGAGRDKPEPEKLDTVKVGFIGPIQATVSIATGGKSHEEALGVPMLNGSRLAVEEWNARGGYLKRKIPFELVVSNDNGLWGSSGNEIIKQAYKDEVWGMLGTIDGANSHIAIRVALKAEVLMINSGDTDPTFIETNIPWVARVIGDDRQQAYLLTDYWYRKLNLKKVAIIRSSNRYGRFGVREIRDSARRMQRPVPIEMAYKVGQKDFRLEVERVKNANPDAVVHWGDAVEGALVLNTMREMGMTQPFFGCDRTVNEEFVKLAGKNADGVVAAFPWNPERKDPKLERFRKAYRDAVRRRGRDLRRARLRRDEPDAVGHQRGRSQPREDPRPDRLRAAPVAGRHGRHRLLGLPRRRGRHLPRHLRARRVEVRLALRARDPQGLHRPARPAEPRGRGGARARVEDRDDEEVTSNGPRARAPSRCHPEERDRVGRCHPEGRREDGSRGRSLRAGAGEPSSPGPDGAPRGDKFGLPSATGSRRCPSE